MIVQMLLVQMGGDNDLKLVAPHFLSGLNADGVALLRGDLSGLEALIAVPCDIAIVFAKLLLSQDHLLQSDFLDAVDSGDIFTHISFIGILGIGKDIDKILHGRINRLCRIFYIFNQIPEPALNVPQLCCCHRRSPLWGWWLRSESSGSSREGLL